MTHPLYPVACRMVGRVVVAHHISGRKYTGVLHLVSNSGIYLHSYPYSVSYKDEEDSVVLSIEQGIQNDQVSLVYSPVAFFGFGALTGLTLGALAGGYYW